MLILGFDNTGGRLWMFLADDNNFALLAAAQPYLLLTFALFGVKREQRCVNVSWMSEVTKNFWYTRENFVTV